MNYIVPAILALLVGYTLWQIKKERVSLSYLFTESDDFPRDDGTGKYFILELINTGNKAIENIDLNILFNTEVIDTISCSDEKLVKNIKQTGNSLNGEIPLLNPKEVFKVTITASGKDHIGSPKISARAIGVTATPYAERSSIQVMIPTFALIIAISTLAYTTYNIGYKYNYKSLDNVEEIKKDLDDIKGNIGATLNSDSIESLKINIERIQSKLSEKIPENDKFKEFLKNEKQGAPESAQKIFSIFNQSGISYLFPDLVENNGEVKFWKTGAYLIHQYLRDKKERKKYIKAMKKLIDIENMAPSSYGFNLYLLAKMEQHEGNTNNAMKYLSLCREKTPLMYEYLMAQDPSYNTKELEKYYSN